MTITRSGGSVTYPARFTLVAATNPCPCGWSGDPVRTCRCTPALIDGSHASIGFDRKYDVLDRTFRIVPTVAIPVGAYTFDYQTYHGFITSPITGADFANSPQGKLDVSHKKARR